MLLAAVSWVEEAPGKFVAVKRLEAGSVLSVPKVTVGTACTLLFQKVTWVKLNPKERLCALRATLNVSLICLTGVLWRFGPFTTVALVMPPAAMPRLKPCWFATGPVNWPTLASGKKSIVPPWSPARSSLTMLEETVERHAAAPEKRMDGILALLGKPGNAGSELFKKSTPCPV